MFVYRPRSFLTLVLVGFACVALPLIIAFIMAIIHVNQLVTQSQRAIFHAVRVTEGSRMLVEQIIAMERSARQFHVLRDEALFRAYIATHQKFQQTTNNLLQLPLDDFHQQQLQILSNKEQQIYDILHTRPSNSLVSEKALLEFPALTVIGKSILTKSHRLIDHETERMQQAASKTQRMFAWQALALILGTAIFALAFIRLISRPVKQLDQGIRQLGDGDFSKTPFVTGPRDLEELGKRLNWLRLRLIELEAEKRKFLQHVSHELKTPLAAIREGAELLSEDVVGKLNEQQREISDILQQKSKHLHKLIEALLNFRMAQAHNTSLEIKPTSLYRLIEDVVIDHKPIIMAKHLDLECDLIEVLVFGDGEKLRVVVDNLLSNAVKYSFEGGKIRISLRRKRDDAVVDIVDSGPGIHPQAREKVFEPFYQEDTEHDRPVKGNGIGLSIAREYVLAHGGHIDIVDEPLQGAHFRVTLPVNLKDVM
jgi:two-component system sensor histidine kinase GlrK